MFEADTRGVQGMRPRRIVTLQAENARLRRLLARRQSIRLDVDLTGGATAAASGAAEEAVVGYLRERGGGQADLVHEASGGRRTSEDVRRHMLASTMDDVVTLDLAGCLIETNDGVLGTVPAGARWADAWSLPESRVQVERAVEQAGVGGTTRFQAAMERDDTEGTVWWDIVVAPLNGADGRPERILAVSRDITEFKQNEARQSILMLEMAHRMKNTLAMVQAVATQTLRNAVSLEAASDALGARLLALAQAHDVLMQGSWASAALRGMVDTAVTLHSDGEPGRFVVEGPDVTLGPKPGMTLALILHELGTNAAKYGALSNRDGHVAITWSVDDDERLHFRWEEIGGPPVKPPTRVGFGTRLIERSLVHSFGGSARLAFPATGVVLTMEAPFDAVVVGGVQPAT